MDVTCNVINDLLPAYADNSCTEATKKLVEEHIEICEECKRKLDIMTEDISAPKTEAKADFDPMKKVKKRFWGFVAIAVYTYIIVMLALLAYHL